MSILNVILNKLGESVVIWKQTLETGLGPSGEERLSQKTNLIIKNHLRRRDSALHSQTKFLTVIVVA